MVCNYISPSYRWGFPRVFFVITHVTQHTLVRGTTRVTFVVKGDTVYIRGAVTQPYDLSRSQARRTYRSLLSKGFVSA